MASKKKMTSFADLKPQFLFMDGSKLDIEFEEMTLKNFRQIDMLLLGNLMIRS